MYDTAGFVRHHTKTGTVCTHTRYGYGVCGYGYGVKNPDPRCTCDEPYSHTTQYSCRKMINWKDETQSQRHGGRVWEETKTKP